MVTVMKAGKEPELKKYDKTKYMEMATISVILKGIMFRYKEIQLFTVRNGRIKKIKEEILALLNARNACYFSVTTLIGPET